MTIASVIDGHGSSRIALVEVGDEGDILSTVTYGSLRQRVDELRTVFDQHGIQRGDRVVVAAGQEPTFVAALLAVVGLGAIAVPVSCAGPVTEFARSIAGVDPKLVACGAHGVWLMEHEAQIGTPTIDVSTASATSTISPVIAAEPDDLAVLLLTSGVSATPKAAMLSHGNLDWMQRTLLNGVNGPTADDRTLGVLPFTHIFGLNVVLLTGLRAGSCVYLVNRFRARPTLELIAGEKITQVAGVPPMWRAWADLEGPADALQSVRYASSGAAALPVGVFQAVRDIYGREIAEGYGLTETSPVVTSSRDIDPRPGSVGVALAGVEVRILEPDGSDVDPGDIGEIWVRSPGVFKGYWNDVPATRAVLTDDGWFFTGDVGAFDDDGFLYLVDRIKDVIIVSGFNVYPAELEEILMEHPDIDGAIVVGVPDERTGEAIEAYVDGDVPEAELRAFLDERLSRYKRPAVIHFVEELPITPAGKRVRRELR